MPPPPTHTQLVVYLLLKLLILPWLMVLVTAILGIGGTLGKALVLLSVVPVAQTAFVVSEQYEVGTTAVTTVMMAGLLLLLPHLLCVLAVIDLFGLYPTT